MKDTLSKLTGLTDNIEAKLKEIAELISEKTDIIEKEVLSKAGFEEVNDSEILKKISSEADNIIEKTQSIANKLASKAEELEKKFID
jgi:cell division septum initiation protein DivIVA